MLPRISWPQKPRPGAPNPQQLCTKLHAALPVNTSFFLSAERRAAAVQFVTRLLLQPHRGWTHLWPSCSSPAIVLTRLRSSKVQLGIAGQQLSNPGLNDQAAEGRGRAGQRAQLGSLQGRQGQNGRSTGLPELRFSALIAQSSVAGGPSARPASALARPHPDVEPARDGRLLWRHGKQILSCGMLRGKKCRCYKEEGHRPFMDTVSCSADFPCFFICMRWRERAWPCAPDSTSMKSTCGHSQLLQGYDGL